MIRLLTNRVAVAWLLLVAVVSAAAALIWLSVAAYSPRANDVVIYAEDPPTPPAQATSVTSSLDPAGRQEPPSVTARGAPATTEATPTTRARVQATTTPATIAVYVSGAVLKPGVYSLAVGSRVSDAVAAAGGATEDADLERINLAARVTDEQHLAVPRIGETPMAAAPGPAQQVGATGQPPVEQAAPPAPEAPPEPVGKVNINTAGSNELQALPGIGPALAARIIEFRQANGQFAAIEDIMLVPGIKTGLFAKVKDHITVNGE